MTNFKAPYLEEDLIVKIYDYVQIALFSSTNNTHILKKSEEQFDKSRQ